MKSKGKRVELSAKMKSYDTLQLESMASGLRSMRGGQRSILKLIEAEIRRRDDCASPETCGVCHRCQEPLSSCRGHRRAV